MESAQKLKKLIEGSGRILITSHISPDPDSICSILLLGTTLEANYPDKQILMVSEEQPDNLSFMHDFKKIKKQPLLEAIDTTDLIIMVDAMNFGRCSRNDWQEISKRVETKKTPLVIVDHHEPVGIDDNTAYINEGYPAAVQQVYETCFNQLNLKKPEGYAETTMVGLYADTGGFAYLNDRYKETLNLVSELLGEGAKVEVIKNKLTQYTEDQLKVVSELAANLTHFSDYSHSFLSDEFVNEWVKNNRSLLQMHTGTKVFMDNFIRNISGRIWGFVTYRDPLLGEGYYSVSLRSVGGLVDVSLIAGKMNGGGHKGASGAKIQASSISEATQKVKDTIKQSR